MLGVTEYKSLQLLFLSMMEERTPALVGVDAIYLLPVWTVRLQLPQNNRPSIGVFLQDNRYGVCVMQKLLLWTISVFPTIATGFGFVGLGQRVDLRGTLRWV
jgi:hypothetical protein